MKILIKIGSALISRSNRIAYEWLETKIDEIAGLHNTGDRIVLVSSGAVAAGMEIRGFTERPRDTLQLQLLSGQGQPKLIKYYKDLFKAKGIFVAQVLLTHHNFTTPREERTIVEILNAYIGDGVIPIINENDMVNKEELDYEPIFTDNDILAALVAKNLGVDLVVILTDVDGLYGGDPKDGNHTAVIETVEFIDDEVRAMAAKGKSSLGLGGMSSKVEAAAMITDQGTDTIVANGMYSLQDIIGNRVRRTLFKARPKRAARQEYQKPR